MTGKLKFFNKTTVRPFSLIFIIGVIFFWFAWFVSDIKRAVLIDHFFLYYVDDIFRYCYIKALPFNPIIMLNYSLKIGYAIIAGSLYSIFPSGVVMLRIMNVLFSCGILFLIYKLGQKLSLSTTSSHIAIILAATFPIFFLSSLSTISEVMYSFFLILLIYTLYSKKYKLSVFLTAFLPLFRQEGLVFIFILLLLLYKHVKIKYLTFLFLPTLIWVLLNQQLLGHDFGKLIFYLPDTYPANSMASFKQLKDLFILLSYHPIMALSLVGLISTINDIKYRFLRFYFVGFIFFILIFQLAHFYGSGGMFCREIRILMPMVPLMALYSAKALDRVEYKQIYCNKLIALFIIFLLVIILVLQVLQLQRDPTAVKDNMTKIEEESVRDVSIWLNSYMRKLNIKKICVVPGGLSTDKIIRRLWMYLPGYIEFYAAAGSSKILAFNNSQIFDLATLKNVNHTFQTKCIFVAKENLDKNIFIGASEISLINTYPAIPLYFYSVTYNLIQQK